MHRLALLDFTAPCNRLGFLVQVYVLQSIDIPPHHTLDPFQSLGYVGSVDSNYNRAPFSRRVSLIAGDEDGDFLPCEGG